jgi:hypothetical protein
VAVATKPTNDGNRNNDDGTVDTQAIRGIEGTLIRGHVVKAGVLRYAHTG